MKHIITVLLISGLYLTNYSQISIKDYSGLELTNATSFLPSDIDYHFEITNEGSSEITFIVEVTAYTVPGDANGISVCTGDICIPITSVPRIIGSSTFLAAGDTYGEEGNLTRELTDVNYSSNGSEGQATITIKVYEEGNETNFAEFTLDTELVGINSVNTDNLISLYPNPAADYFTVKTSNELNDSYLVFTNLLGKVVFKKNIDSSEQIVSTKQFASGIYFYSLLNNGVLVETKKLIIK